MPTIKLNKKTVLDLLGKNISDDLLAEKISMLGTDLEEITKDEINVEIFPNRPDLLSEQGFARALKSFLEIELGLKKYNVKKSNYKMIIDKSVKKVRPYTACCVVKNLNFDDEKIKEVIQIQEKLHVTFGRNRKKAAIGIYPLEHIKMPIYFKAQKPENIFFQPLESNRDMNGLEILRNHPTGKEYAHLLEGLDKFPFFIDSNNNILSLPPIINSNKTGRITFDTKEVFIECSGFDKEVLSKCLNMIVTALADMGGEIYEMEVENLHENLKYKLPNLNPDEMSLDLDYVNKRLGLNLTKKDAIHNLSKMGYGYDSKKDKVLIPAYRNDILHSIDLVEDISIAYGFDNFNSEIPNVSTIGSESKIEVFKQKLRETLIGLGMYESKTYNISSSQTQTTYMNLEINKDLILLKNSLTKDFDCLRKAILPSILNTLKINKSYEYPQLFFDFGRVFFKDTTKETNICEKDNLGIVVCQANSDFTKIKQILDVIFNSLGINYKLEELNSETYINGRQAKIIYKSEIIGELGEIHPGVLNNFELEMPTCGIEIDIQKLFELYFKEK